jgi:hypothetical protein
MNCLKYKKCIKRNWLRKKKPYKINPAKWGETHQTKLRVPWIMVCGGMQS